MSFLESEYGSLQLHNLTSAAIRIQVLKGWGGKDGLEPIMGYDEIPSGDSGYVSWSESLYLNNDIVSSFESQNVIADNRPANPKIPEPRIVPLHILLNDQPIDLQLRVTYRLNEQYINDSVYNFEHACQSPEEALFRELAPLGGFVCIWLSALLAGVYIYLRSRSNKVPQNKAGGHV